MLFCLSAPDWLITNGWFNPIGVSSYCGIAQYILADNDMEFQNHLMDQVLHQLSMDHIFSAPYHPQEQWKIGSI